MVKAESILALTERLRGHARRAKGNLGADLRLARLHLRRYAALLIADEAAGEPDPSRKAQLIEEIVSLRCSEA